MTVVRRCDVNCKWNISGESYACDLEQIEISKDGICKDFEPTEKGGDKDAN